MLAIHTRAPRAIAAAFAVLLFGHAFTGIYVAQAAETYLTPETVKQFIASFPQVKAIVTAHAVTEGTKAASDGKNGNEANALATLVEAVTNKALKNELDTAARANDFRDGKEWLSAAQRITRTYAYIRLNPDQAKAQKKLNKAIAKIEETEFLSDKQKRKLIDALRENVGVVVEPPAGEDLAAVKPFVEELDALVK
jgi:hypothetical protein